MSPRPKKAPRARSAPRAGKGKRKDAAKAQTQPPAETPAPDDVRPVDVVVAAGDLGAVAGLEAVHVTPETTAPSAPIPKPIPRSALPDEIRSVTAHGKISQIA